MGAGYLEWHPWAVATEWMALSVTLVLFFDKYQNCHITCELNS